MSTTEATSAWTKLPPIEAHHGGCLNCGPRPAQFPPDGVIAVGFGYAALHKDGVPFWTELNDVVDDELMTGELLRLLPAVVAAMGGELARTPDLTDNAKEQA